jgi:hypothetical protein
MKHLATLLAVFFLSIAASQAETWINVSVSLTVLQGGPTVTKTTLTSRKYLEEGARRFAVDPNLKNYFVGFRVSTGAVAVVHIPSKTVAYNIVGGLNTAGNASNGTNTTSTITGNATVSSLNVDFGNSYFMDKVVRKTDGTVSSVARTVLGGTGNLTINGTIRASGKRYEL